MSCPCKGLERQYGNGGCKCVHYREQFPDCECENCSVSDHSPGPVHDREVLIRTVYSPHQINQETGEVDPAHFRHDALKRGLSVNRKSHITEADLETRIVRKIENDRAAGRHRENFYKVVTARCSEIRALVTEDGRRLFCVYDTATEVDASHADVCQALALAPGTRNRRALEKKFGSRLFELFSKTMALTTAYTTE